MKMDNFFSSSDDVKSYNYSNSGFMDLLGLQDLGSLFYDHHVNNVLNDEFFFSTGSDFGGNGISAVDSCDHQKKVHILPSTPNSSSVSSLSCEVINDKDKLVAAADEHEFDDDNGDEQKNILGLKGKKRNINNQKKKQSSRGARFAFMTKSEVDHLDDGYRWRKYGQKAVKNSPFPRSYYRCTSATCGVKKRVERSCDDSAIVMTTYEGQHTHPSPITPHCRINSNVPAAVFPGSAFFSGGGQQLTYANIHLQQHQHQQQPLVHHHGNSPPTPNLQYGGTQNSVFCRDNGLLQDMIIPAFKPKEEK